VLEPASRPSPAVTARRGCHPSPGGRAGVSTPSATCHRVSRVSLREKTVASAPVKRLKPLLKRLPNRTGSISPRKRSWAFRLQGVAPSGDHGLVSAPASSRAVRRRRNVTLDFGGLIPPDRPNGPTEAEPPGVPSWRSSPLRLSLSPPGRRSPAPSSRVLSDSAPIPRRTGAPNPSRCTSEFHLAASRFRGRSQATLTGTGPSGVHHLFVSRGSSLPLPKERPTHTPDTFSKILRREPHFER